MPNAWNRFSVTVPKTAAAPISRIGFELTSGAAWAGTVFIDSIGPTKGDAGLYTFESGSQGWVSAGGSITSVASSNAVVFAGAHSLAVDFGGTSTAATSTAYVSAPAARPGTTVVFHIWVPAGSGLSAVNPFVE